MSSKFREVILHYVFTPKYRRPCLTGEVAFRLMEIIHQTCEELHVEVVALAIQPDHLHLLISEPRSLSRARLVQMVKGRSSRYLRLEFPHLKEVSPKALWGRDYFVRSVGGGRKAVAKYIQSQDLS